MRRVAITVINNSCCTTMIKDEENDQKGQFLSPRRQPNSLVRYLFFAGEILLMMLYVFDPPYRRALIVIVPAATKCHIRGEVDCAS